MAEHDKFCDSRTHESWCDCRKIDVIRADERERILSELEGPARESEAMYAHAEQVAARLVEVICEDAESEAWLEESNQQLQGQITQLIQNGYRLRRERDAARVRADEREQIKAEFLAGGGSKQSAELFSIAYDRGYIDAMNDMEAFVSDLREERGGNG